MRSRILVFCLISLLIARPGRASAAPSTPAELSKIQLETDALVTLRDLNLSPDQLKELREISENVAGPMPAPGETVDSQYATAVGALHDAILTGDDDRIGIARQRVYDLEEKLDLDTPTPKLTAAACAKAGNVVKLLNPHQVAEYLAQVADDLPDAQVLLGDALDQCHDISAEQFAQLRQDVADEISTLVAFKAPGAPKPAIYQKVIAFLDRARSLSEDEFKIQRPALDEEARDLVKDIGPFSAIKCWVEREMAELLANPELHDAMDEYQKIAPANR